MAWLYQAVWNSSLCSDVCAFGEDNELMRLPVRVTRPHPPKPLQLDVNELPIQNRATSPFRPPLHTRHLQHRRGRQRSPAESCCVRGRERPGSFSPHRGMRARSSCRGGRTALPEENGSAEQAAQSGAERARHRGAAAPPAPGKAAHPAALPLTHPARPPPPRAFPTPRRPAEPPVPVQPDLKRRCAPPHLRVAVLFGERGGRRGHGQPAHHAPGAAGRGALRRGGRRALLPWSGPRARWPPPDRRGQKSARGTEFGPPRGRGRCYDGPRDPLAPPTAVRVLPSREPGSRPAAPAPPSRLRSRAEGTAPTAAVRVLAPRCSERRPRDVTAPTREAPPPARDRPNGRRPPPPRPAALPAPPRGCGVLPGARPPPRLPMEAETEARLLLQEARESIEAARSYRRELQQRLRGLHQARQQVGGRPGSFRQAERRGAVRGREGAGASRAGARRAEGVAVAAAARDVLGAAARVGAVPTRGCLR